MNPRRILGIYGEGMIMGSAQLAKKIEKVLDSPQPADEQLFKISKLCRKARKEEAEIL